MPYPITFESRRRAHSKIFEITGSQY
jgi:hypothetical protein